MIKETYHIYIDVTVDKFSWRRETWLHVSYDCQFRVQNNDSGGGWKLSEIRRARKLDDWFFPPNMFVLFFRFAEQQKYYNSTLTTMKIGVKKPRGFNRSSECDRLVLDWIRNWKGTTNRLLVESFQCRPDNGSECPAVFNNKTASTTRGACIRKFEIEKCWTALSKFFLVFLRAEIKTGKLTHVVKVSEHRRQQQRPCKTRVIAYSAMFGVTMSVRAHPKDLRG